MTKEEEIDFKKKIKEETVSRDDELIDAAKRNAAIVSEFLIGARWADQNPKKGLWDANKVLAWISQNIESYCKLDAKNFNNLLFDLEKAMED